MLNGGRGLRNGRPAMAAATGRRLSVLNGGRGLRNGRAMQLTQQEADLLCSTVVAV